MTLSAMEVGDLSVKMLPNLLLTNLVDWPTTAKVPDADPMDFNVKLL